MRGLEPGLETYWKSKLTKNCEKIGKIWNFLLNHDEIADFSEIVGEIVKFLWKHGEMTDFNNEC